MWRFLHYFFFTRALLRGPRSFARYETRRAGRRTIYRMTRSHSHRRSA